MSDDATYTLLELDWNDPRAIALRDAMDVEIQPRYAGRGTDPSASTRALAVDPKDIVLTIIAIGPDGIPVGHAALRRLGAEWEVKRVVVLAQARGAGVGRLLMAHLENFAIERNIPRLILQTGDRQPDAVALYRKLGYSPIPIYPPYTDAIPFSMCFEKVLTRS
jgi:GNAT superfamily N-acetyltransferase